MSAESRKQNGKRNAKIADDDGGDANEDFEAVGIREMVSATLCEASKMLNAFRCDMRERPTGCCLLAAR